MKKIYYKGFDKNLQCRGYQFEVGKTYEIEGELSICNNGFHFCKDLKNVLEYYGIVGSRFCKIEALGDILKQDNKLCSNKIKIIKELSREEMMELLECKNNNLGLDNLGDSNTGDSNTGNRNTGDSNTGNWNTGDSNTGDSNTGDSNTGNRNTGDRNTGDRNTGYRNTGYRNTGNRNTGNRNTGYRNTGDSNTGNWNTGDSNTGNWNTGNWNTGDSNTGNWNTGNWNTTNYETGCFNSKQSDFINIFNKKCKREVWNNAIKPIFIFDVEPNIWVSLDSMSFEEIAEIEQKVPQLKNQGGYLKNISMKEAWKIAFKNATEKDIELLKSLPNYSYKVFKEISGIEDDRLK